MAGIITNNLSLVAQNNLEKSKTQLGRAIERLSSGYRINNAKDDAAGQAIANRFTSNITGLAQAARNANDGISLAQTTEGALTEINNNLQRIRELTVQGLNGSNSRNDLNSIQTEINQRAQEINRVCAQTQFNGVKVLSQQSSLSLQVGANDNEVININLNQINATKLGLDSFQVNGDRLATEADLVSILKATGFDIFTASVVSGSGTITGPVTYDIRSRQVLLSGSGGVNTPVYFNSANNTLTVANSTSHNSLYTASGTTTAPGNSLAVAFVNSSVASSGNNHSFSLGNIQVTPSGTIDANGNGDYILHFSDGSTGSVTIANATGLSNNGGPVTLRTNTNFYTNSSNEITADPGLVLNRAATLADLQRYGVKEGAQLTVTATSNPGIYLANKNGKITLSGSTTADPTEEIYLSNAEGAYDLFGRTYIIGRRRYTSIDPLATIDAAISSVDVLRGRLGAAQNRLESTIANLNNTLINIKAARSRIEDADYTVEVSNMGKNQILQQAGTAVLAQANQVPQTVLALLR